MAQKPLDDVIDELHGYIRRDVAAGFLAPEDIVRLSVELLRADCDPIALDAAATQLTERAVREHMTTQAGWPALTDCDRLDAAFDALERSSILARQNFSCCGTCGASEIREEIAVAELNGTPVRGYAFYHQQDTEGAIEGGGLYLSYGAATGGEAEALAIGHEVVAVLRAKGLNGVWSGSWAQRIGVELDWKRRRDVED